MDYLKIISTWIWEIEWHRYIASKVLKCSMICIIFNDCWHVTQRVSIVHFPRGIFSWHALTIRPLRIMEQVAQSPFRQLQTSYMIWRSRWRAPWSRLFIVRNIPVLNGNACSSCHLTYFLIHNCFDRFPVDCDINVIWVLYVWFISLLNKKKFAENEAKWWKGRTLFKPAFPGFPSDASFLNASPIALPKRCNAETDDDVDLWLVTARFDDAGIIKPLEFIPKEAAIIRMNTK